MNFRTALSALFPFAPFAVMTVALPAVVAAVSTASFAAPGVPEDVRELEEAESRLRGGIYQVPVPQAPAKSQSLPAFEKTPQPSKAKRAGNEPMGVDIDPVQEAGEKSSSALTDVAARVAEIQARTSDMRARILTLQEEMSARLGEVSYAKITLQVKEPAVAHAALGAASSGQNAPRKWPLAVHELSAALDEVPLVERHHPRRLERDAVFPLYEGPLPTGEYALRIRMVIGLLGAGWPSQVGHGRWLIEETVTLKHMPTRGAKGIDATVVLEPALGDAKPTVSLQVREAR